MGIFLNEQAVTRPVGAILIEWDDEWAVERARYLLLPPTPTQTPTNLHLAAPAPQRRLNSTPDLRRLRPSLSFLHHVRGTIEFGSLDRELGG